MRIRIIGQVLAAVLLLGGLLVAPMLDLPVTHVVADEGKDESGNNGNGNGNSGNNGNGNNGNGNRGNNGNGNGNSGKKKDKDEDRDGGNGEAITSSGGYVVVVECDYDESAATSTCTFTGVVPDGGKKINHLDVPQETVCAEVIGGEYKEITSDPHTGVTGYQTKGSTDTVTLVLDGHAAPGGTATYWLKAANNILPVTGPGLSCDEPAAAAFELQTTPGSGETAPEPTTTPEPTRGELAVLIYTCADVPEDTTDYDWFRLCDAEGGVHELSLARISETAVDPVLASTDESGDATFADLEPGLYSLEMTDGTWCKAMSDNVDAEGNVIIEAGQRTTIYGFVCEGKPAA